MSYKPRKFRKKKKGMRFHNDLAGTVSNDATQTERDIIDKAQKNAAMWDGYFRHNVERFKNNRRFLYQNQWDSQSEAQRLANGKPCMQFNYIISAINQIISEARLLEFSLEVRATTKDTQQKVLDIKAGLIRKTLYDSKFPMVAAKAFEHDLTGGFSVFILSRDYKDCMSFEQVMKIDALNEPGDAFFDPSARKADKSDGEFCGYVYYVYKEYLKKEHPELRDTDLQSFNYGNENDGFRYDNVNSGDMIKVCHYYIKKHKKIRIVQLSDGRVMKMKEYKKMVEESIGNMDPNVIQLFGQSLQIPTIVNEREDVETTIKEYKLLQNKILEESEWPIDKFPLIFCANDPKIIDGKEQTYSYIEPAIDSQRYLNYLMSESAVSVLNSRKEQFIVTPENVSGYEEMWRNPDRVQGALIANPDPRTGAMPTRIPPMEIPQTLMSQAQQTIGSIQQILNRTEASLGQRSNEVSGIAITNRAKRGDLGTYLYFDNLNNAIESVGQVILDMIPHLHDTEKTVTVRNEEGDEYEENINVATPMGYMNDVTGKGFALTVTASAGSSIQKQEALQQIMQLVSINPQSAPMLMDLIAANMDVQNMPQIVQRMENFVPPEILAKEKGLPPPPKPPQQPDPAMLDMKLKEQKLQHEIEQDNIDNQLQQQKMQLDAEKMRASAQIQREKMLTELRRAQMDKEQVFYKHING